MNRPDIRPIKITDFIGQRKASEAISQIVGAAQETGQQPRHILIEGFAGTGKTTCARIIAGELGLHLVNTIGASITNIKVMTDILMSIREGDVLFIDEIHGVGGGSRNGLPTFEVLYTAMEDFRLTVTLANGATRMQLDWQMPAFTVIGATTRLSKVPMPLRRRFPNSLTLDYYQTSDLATILKADAGKLGIDASDEAISEIAKRGRGTPGTAINLLYNVVDFASASGVEVTPETVAEAMLVQGVDDCGLNDKDRDYLNALFERFKDAPAGVGAIASVLGLQDNIGTVTDVIEPWLLRCGFIDRTPRGRVLTDAGRKHVVRQDNGTA